MFKTIHSVFLCLAICILTFLVGSAALHAQTYTQGSIAGTVFDASGAVVANADIAIHNTGTDAETHLTSDGSGFFKAPRVAGRCLYAHRRHVAGFAPFHEVEVIVQVGQTTEVNPHLQAAGSEHQCGSDRGCADPELRVAGYQQ